MPDCPSYIDDQRIEPLVDGMRELLAKNLAAGTDLIQSALAGDTVLKVANTLRFERGDQIAVLDADTVWDEDAGRFEGIEFHTIAKAISAVDTVELERPLQKAFSAGKQARIRKAVRNAILYPGDVHYGDRNVITADYVAVCVEPENLRPEWLALGGLASHEYRLAIMIYVKYLSGDAESEDRAIRVCNAYADSIFKLLLGNIHVDLVVDEVPLRADAQPGDEAVIIGSSVAAQWPPDACYAYELRDNFKAAIHYRIRSIESTSSSASSSQSFEESSSSRHSASSSSRSEISSASSSSASPSSASSPSSSSFSTSQTESLSSSESSPSSESTQGGPGTPIYLTPFVRQRYRVRDKAVLRRKRRYFYDSRPESVEYGVVQKGSAILKAAKISWFGKETHVIPFPQVGRGGAAFD
jgi:hypothetical protein